MRFLLTTALVVAAMSGARVGLADERIYGIWASEAGPTRIEIMDGFKSGVGPALMIEEGEPISSGRWTRQGGGLELKIGYSSGGLILKNGGAFEWRGTEYTRTAPIGDDARVRLAEDGDRFVAALTAQRWRTSLDGDSAVFKTTFADDGGVVETFDADGKLDSLDPWSVSSDVLKIDDTLIIEARISRKYLIGRDDDDDFVVLKASDALETPDRTSLERQRQAFLDALVTGRWKTVSFLGVTEHAFRPIEGPLKGRLIEVRNDNLTGSEVWEYSPSSGALKIGYTEYPGGMVVDDTLALQEEDGDQVFFKRLHDGDAHTFSTADVRALQVNETEAPALRQLLAGQFQRKDYLYRFEFGQGGDRGYIHEWRSVPFRIRAQSWSSDILADFETLYEVEDFIVMGDRRILKRDASIARLAPQSEAEMARDQARAAEQIERSQQRRPVLKITRSDGSEETLVLPVDSMSDISGLEIRVE